MILNVLGIFFTSALICSAAPTLEKEHCGKPSQIEGATLQGVWNAETYSPGSVATFTCLHGYIRDGPIKMACIEGSWFDISRGQCKILGQCSKPQQSHENGELEGQWNDETFPPGKTATYICRQGYHQTKPIKMACVEGEWIHISKGQCFAEGSCSKPEIAHGSVTAPKLRYKDRETTEYSCDPGYKPSTPTGLTCTKNDWSPMPLCEEIVCYQETVKYGNVKYTKETYRDGETVELTCIEGYKIEHNPEELRKCTSRGWSPPLKCISKRCDKPILLNGYIDSWASFPVSPGRSVYSVCNSGFSTSTKESYETITCTKNGWDREPKCFKKCYSPSQNSINAVILYTSISTYIEGDKLQFQCYRDYTTLDGKQTGEITCLPDGTFSGEKCHIPCHSAPPLIRNGEISKETLADRSSTGSTVKYICADGYHIIGSVENKCIDGKWLPPPTCIEKSCGNPQEIENGKPRDGRKEYKHAESAAYECSLGYKLSGSEAAVCLYGKWERIPKCIYSACGPPRKISNGEIRGQKTTYLTGEKVIYDCVRGFTVGNNPNFITCENAAWTEPPECRRIGQSCGGPPVVQNGDVTDLKKLSYPSGSIVKYKCANYYKLEGKETITCRDGEWEKEPICRVPCTVRDIDMQQNNIRFKHREDRKLYSEHFENMTFVCIPGYKISDEKLLKIQCLDGVLKYPKCLKEGFCVLQQTEMSRNNIRYNKSNEIENGQTIEFECVEGMVPENGLKGTCMNKRIMYPKCSTGRPCLPPKISNALISPKKEDSYESGSSIDIKCEDTYVLNGHISVKCDNGQWDELPQCFKPCTISTRGLDKNHIEIKSSENPLEILEHGTEVNVKCKANFRRPGSLTALCYDGIVKYPRCFSGEICRINQQSLDDNFLELDEKHDNEVFYGEGETVSFKCKAGYSNRTGLTGTCTKPEKEANYGLTYPVCT